MKLNKLLFVLFSVALSLGFTSCSDDDDDNQLSQETIVGTWTYSKMEVKVETGNPLVNIALNNYLNSSEAANQMNVLDIYSFTFDKDGNYVEKSSVNDMDPETGEYRIDGGKIYLTDDEDDEYAYDAFLSGTDLTLTLSAKNMGIGELDIDMGILSEILASTNVNPEDVVFKTITIKGIYSKTASNKE